MKKIRGFTLIELLVVIAIASVVLAFGVPSLVPFIQNTRITTVTNNLISSLHVARSEAIKLNGVACVCSSNNVNAAVPACNAAGSWEQGWIAFYDVAGTCQYNVGVDTLLKVWDGTSSSSDQITVRTSSPSITSVNYVRFNNRGAPKSTTGAIQQGTFNICDARGNTDVNGKSVARGVQLTVAGSVKSTNKSSKISCP